MVVSVEDVSSSLVREYLSRKGLKRTITCMDEEHPRTESSINTRSDLRHILHMDVLYKNNKIQKTPLKTLLEIIVKHHIERHKDDKTTFKDTIDPIQTTPTLDKDLKAHPEIQALTDTDTDGLMSLGVGTAVIPRSFIGGASLAGAKCEEDRHLTHNPKKGFLSDTPAESLKEQQPLTSPTESFIRRDTDKKNMTDSGQKNKTNRIRRGMMAAPIASSPQESNRKRPSRKAAVPPSLLVNEVDNRPTKEEPSVTDLHQTNLDNDLIDLHRAESIQKRAQSWNAPGRGESLEGVEKLAKDKLKTRREKPSANQNVAELQISELMLLDDIDDAEELREISQVSLQTSITQQSFKSYPMDQHTSNALKEVILGSTANCFSVEWRCQSFTFSETHDLRYGLVQKKGGPCGVLASIQAYVLKKLVFEETDSTCTSLNSLLRPSNSTRRKCLTLALAEILWRAGEEKQATLVITSARNHFIPTGHCKSDGIFEKITCFTVDKLKDLQLLVEQHIQQFESGPLGCILMTISAVLSRSIEKVREDMDVPTTSLIGIHSYCTQELVNLLLCGKAVSNVFDDNVELDSGNGNLTLLKGIKGRCDIGLLSLFEHYNIVKVGANLQNPHFPIWVVCSESHFSVLFGLQRGLLTNEQGIQEFDLYYYDGLANQQEDIRLTIFVGTSPPKSPDLDSDLTPPLEHCIRTKWKDAVINWNDTEPIL